MYKKLLSQTLIYGLSNVLIRIFPFLLNPILTRIYGATAMAPFIDFYSMGGIISVILTHGMETTYFKYAQEKDVDKEKLFSTIMISVFAISIFFMSAGFIFRQELADAFKTPNQVNFLTWFLFILGFDSMAAILFGKLRLEEKTKMFCGLKVLNSLFQFLMVIFFVTILPKFSQEENSFKSIISSLFYNPNIGVGYTFIANLIASVLTFVALIPYIKIKSISFDFSLWKKLMAFGIPITIAGLSGNINETLDRQLLKYMLPNAEASFQMGLYGTIGKLAVFLTLFRLAYLLGVEPFFFSHAKNNKSGQTYSILMNAFVIVNVIIFLFLTVNINWITKIYIPNPEYWQALKVVPPILLGAVFIGIYLNLSIWYKLTGKTYYGAYISIIGAILTIILNVIFIPIGGYVACAWITMIVYLSMMLISYFWGQKHYFVPYKKRKFIFYILISSFLGFFNFYILNSNFWTGNLFLIIFLILILLIEKKSLNLILDKFKK